MRKSFKAKVIEIHRRERKCLHHYLYLIDPEFGFMHVRIQGWIPYECQIYINGREWLARQLDKGGIGYVRYENSLLAIDDLEAASKLCDHFAHRAWPRVLNAFARLLNPPMLGAIHATPATATADHRPTVTKPTDGARRSHGRSSSSGVTASWRSSLVAAATASPATAIA